MVLKCDQCERPAVVHVTRVRHGHVAGEAHLCEGCHSRRTWIPAKAEAQPASESADADREIRVEVEKVIINEILDQQILVFLDAEGNRHLSFVLGLFEALAIDSNLKGMQWPRPLTHDAWLATAEALGAKVQSACVHSLRESTYFAELRLIQGQEIIRVDMRPSDAFIVAMKAGAPFFFTEKLLAADAVTGDEPA